MSNQIDGQVATIGPTGNLITDVSNESLANVPQDESVAIKFGDHETIGIFPADHDQPAATMVASMGTDGFLEIEIVGISLSEMLGIKPETAVAICW